MAASHATIKLESRVAALEIKVEQLQRALDTVSSNGKPWWEHVVGAFADDPAFEEAMRLGRKYRESLRPNPRAKRVKHAPI
ncbi:MAG: hypothetical protein L0220_03235 [Acidobacteria bacterium]|nr:hypothetical protein [Acidobacteriota bacterium]